MKNIKPLFFSIIFLLLFPGLFAAEGTDLKITLNKPEAPKQFFSINVVPENKNLQEIKLNTYAFESRFFFTISWETKTEKCGGMNSFNFFDIGKLKPKFKNYVVDPKKGASVELKLLTKMTAEHIQKFGINMDELTAMTFQLSLRYLTQKTQDGETEYNTNNVILSADEVKALLAAHKKK